MGKFTDHPLVDPQAEVMIYDIYIYILYIYIYLPKGIAPRSECNFIEQILQKRLHCLITHICLLFQQLVFQLIELNFLQRADQVLKIVATQTGIGLWYKMSQVLSNITFFMANTKIKC